MRPAIRPRTFQGVSRAAGLTSSCAVPSALKLTAPACAGRHERVLAKPSSSLLGVSRPHPPPHRCVVALAKLSRPGAEIAGSDAPLFIHSEGCEWLHDAA